MGLSQGTRHMAKGKKPVPLKYTLNRITQLHSPLFFARSWNSNELELIQSHMTQKPMLRGEGGGRACAHKQDPKKLLENNHWEGVLRKSAPSIINAARRFATWFMQGSRRIMEKPPRLLFERWFSART